MPMILPKELDVLRDLPQWVAFKLEQFAGQAKPKKIPLNPLTGKRAMANNPATWATYDEAVALAERRGYFENRAGGIGFELGNGIAGIDLDDVILPDGTLKGFARGIVELMNSYTEYSPSGTGLHILFRIAGSPEEWREFLGGKLGTRSGGIEFYIGAHFFTITGKPYGAVKPIEERTEQARKFYERYLAKPEVKKETAQKSVNSSAIELTDRELLEKMFSSAHGQEIRALYYGDMSGYANDWSRADLALCNYLAYWCNSDVYRIDRMFRQSGLMRDKWDERHGARTYGEITIAEAVRTTQIYVPSYTQDYSRSDVEGSVSTEGREVRNISSQELVSPETGYDYVSSGKFQADLERFQNFPELRTGFDNFDKAQGGFYPGLYVLGATPSLGKTTFCLQIADNFAKSGNFVFYFALEQGRFELTMKSISRLTAERNTKNAVSAINIRRGKYLNKAQSEIVEQAMADYQKFSSNIAIVELGLEAKVSGVMDTVKRFMEFYGIFPIIIIDYLQLLHPEENSYSTKDAIDYVIKALKKLQVDNNLVVIAISSFNRLNYLTPVDYESFKESGNIEYTADVLLGLQLQVVTDKLFDKEKATKEKREAIDKAISAIPRKVMLKNLKNRFGQKGYSCGFIYDPRFDLFTPDTNFKAFTNEQPTIL